LIDETLVPCVVTRLGTELAHGCVPQPQKAESNKKLRRRASWVQQESKAEEEEESKPEELNEEARAELLSELAAAKATRDSLLDEALQCLTRAEDLREETRQPGDAMDIVFNRARAQFMRGNMVRGLCP
jgi:hypothetical protein